MLIIGDTLDDLLRRVFEKILKSGATVKASRGDTKELCCVLLRLTNPRARLSHTEKRGKIFSALGELAWYLAASNDGKFVTYYIDRYKNEMESDGTVHGAYGPRIFSPAGASQIETVIAMLREKPTTRQAVIQLFDGDDLRGSFKDVPCTCCLQFFVRADRLRLSVSMRSNDAYYGLPHDVFSFTMLQELVARTLGYESGPYSHYAGSLHIYTDRLADARQYINAGWQDREYAAMPPMPSGDPWPNVKLLLEAERAIRSGRGPGKRRLSRVGDYWADLIRLLQVYTLFNNNTHQEVGVLKDQMASRVYRQYIAQKAKPRKTAPKSGQPDLFPADEPEDEAETP